MANQVTVICIDCGGYVSKCPNNAKYEDGRISQLQKVDLL